MLEQFPPKSELNESLLHPEQGTPTGVTEIEVLPGVYETYDNTTGEVVDIYQSEE